MGKKKSERAYPVCSICGQEYQGWGNNAYPINSGRCCNVCNDNHVIPARIAQMYRRQEDDRGRCPETTPEGM